MGREHGISSAATPELSIVLPVYNEERILRQSLDELQKRLHETGLSYEVIVAENGSRDGTIEIAREYADQHPEVQVFSYPEPNYGGALREGIFRARGEFVVCEEVDILDVDFHLCALELLRTRKADMVIGSKAMRGARDNRPRLRRVATRVYNGLLRVTLGFRGTDTHGIKAFRRALLVPVVRRCVIERDVFVSELVIRAEREGARVVEIPVDIIEKRAPSVALMRRVPRVLVNVARLMVSIHLGWDPVYKAEAERKDER
jgi:glycosyltransferase involved in cell wall biosynthesis